MVAPKLKSSLNDYGGTLGHLHVVDESCPRQAAVVHRPARVPHKVINLYIQWHSEYSSY